MVVEKGGIRARPRDSVGPTADFFRLEDGKLGRALGRPPADPRGDCEPPPHVWAPAAFLRFRLRRSEGWGRRSVTSPDGTGRYRTTG
jgi:hypothetical protein